ncbi:MAG: hypothetical protein ACJ8FY_21695 [Gemmataceae bacterium]
MTRHNWIAIFTAGLGASLASGCLWPPKNHVKDNSALPSVTKSDKEEKAAGEGSGSPYHTVSEREMTGPPIPAEPDIQSTQYQEPKRAPEDPGPEERATAETQEPLKSDQQTTAKTSVIMSVAPEPAPEEPLLTAMRCLLDKHPVEALEQIRHYDKSNQELLMHLLPLAVRLTQGSVEDASPTELALVLDQLRGLERPLMAKASLTITKLCLCRGIVDRFGIYEKLPDNYEFAAGSGDQPGERVLVYVEFRNFMTLPNNANFETRLMSTLEIHDYQGHPVWRQDFPTPPDRSQTPRQDYFINYKFWVPPHLPPGSYTLWVQVKDVTGQSGKELPGHRVARRSLDFRVTGQGTTRGPRGGSSVALQSGEGDHERRIMQARARKPLEP